MTHPKPGGNPEQELASAASVAGLASEVEMLRRSMDKLSELPERVEQLGATVADAVDQLAGAGRRPDPVRPVSWLDNAEDPAELQIRLGELVGWVGRVYLRYSVAAKSLPDCWLWHPDVVEELAWLHLAWQTAYHPQLGTVAAAGDWHDRQRPGVVARIRATAGTCSLEAHLAPTTPDLTAPAAEAAPVIAHWWGLHRDQTPPVPDGQLIDAAQARRARAGRGGRR
jgi:hypothetical protein